VRAGLRYFSSQRAQRELAREIAAQFDCFAATGLPLSHVDGHLHMHLHPTVLRSLLSLAVEHSVHGLRVPRDELRLALEYDRDRFGTKALWAAVFGLLGRHCLNELQDRGLKVTDRVFAAIGWVALALSLLVRWLVAWSITGCTGDWETRRWLVWLPLRDVLSALVWCVGGLGRSATWRGERFSLHGAGRMESLSSSAPNWLAGLRAWRH
jgi:hypothetical protein